MVAADIQRIRVPMDLCDQIYNFHLFYLRQKSTIAITPCLVFNFGDTRFVYIILTFIPVIFILNL